MMRKDKLLIISIYVILTILYVKMFLEFTFIIARIAIVFFGLLISIMAIVTFWNQFYINRELMGKLKYFKRTYDLKEHEEYLRYEEYWENKVDKVWNKKTICYITYSLLLFKMSGSINKLKIHSLDKMILEQQISKTANQLFTQKEYNREFIIWNLRDCLHIIGVEGYKKQIFGILEN